MAGRKKLNVGMVGYGFMGRTHSNAFGKVNQFFDLGYEPVLKAVCGRDKEKVEGFRRDLELRILETDWRKLVARKDIDLDRHRRSQRHARRDRHRGRGGRQDGHVRKAAGPQRGGSREDDGGGRAGQSPEHGLVQLPARAGGDAGEATHR